MTAGTGLDGDAERLAGFGQPLTVPEGLCTHIVVRFSTNIFHSQLAKLSSLADPLILQFVCKLYSTLGILEDIATSINKESDRFVESTGPDRISCRAGSNLLCLWRARKQ